MSDINKLEESLDALENSIKKLENELADKAKIDWKKLKVVLTAIVALLNAAVDMIQNEKLKKKFQKIINIMNIVIQALPNS